MENNNPELQVPVIPNLPMPPGTSVPTQALSFPFVGGADPLTAGFNAAAAFFTFLSTPQGQRMVGDILTFDEAFVHECHDVFIKIKNYIEKKA